MLLVSLKGLNIAIEIAIFHAINIREHEAVRNRHIFCSYYAKVKFYEFQNTKHETILVAKQCMRAEVLKFLQYTFLFN